MKQGLAALMLGGAVLLGLSTVASEARELRVLSAWDQNFIFTKSMLKPLLEKIEKGTEGRVTFRINGPEVVPTFQQFEPVQSGAFDMIFAHPGYFAGNAGVGVTIDSIKADPVARRETGIWGYLDKYYAKFGMKLIALQSQGKLHFVVKKELPQADKPFSGLKLRANVTYHNLVDYLGGASVLMAGGEIYPGLKAGLIDGAAWSVVGVMDYRLNEVAGYWTEPAYGQTGATVLMNLNTWNSLSDKDKAVIQEAAFESEKQTTDLFVDLSDEEHKKMQAGGMKPTHFIGPISTKLDALWADGVWKLGIEKAGAEAAAFKEFALSKGMTSTTSK